MELELGKIEVVRYIGGKRHISILFKDKEKYYILYSKTGKMDCTTEQETYSCTKNDIEMARFISTIGLNIIIPMVSCFHIRTIKEEDFELIDEVVASLLED